MSSTNAAIGVDTRRSVRPGWPEILVGLAVLAAVAYGLPALLKLTGITDQISPLVNGLLLAALSGVAGLAGFFAAKRLRDSAWTDFGVRRTSRRWLLIGFGGGILAWVLSRAGAIAYIHLVGSGEDIQSAYREAAQGGFLSILLSVLFLALLTPIGEEFLFRGVITTALLRYGAFVGVVASSVLFALAHGLNEVFVTALVVGLIAAELRRRSDSVWPAVTVHVVNNLIGQLIVVALT